MFKKHYVVIAVIHLIHLFKNIDALSNVKFVLLSVNGSVLTSTVTKSGNHISLLTINLTTNGNENFILDLHLNKLLISSNYRERVISDSGEFYRQFNLSRDHCYYVGVVRGYPESSAAVSTCGDVSGYFIANGKSYTITPANNTNFYPATVQLTPAEQNDFICGYSKVVNDIKKLTKRATSLSSSPTFRQGGVRIIEMYMASDFLHFKLMGSEEKASARIKSIVNAANALYNALNIYVVLVGSEIWTKEVFVVGTNISIALSNWYIYKKDYLNGNVTSHDNAILISAQTFSLNIIGLAYLGSMCDSVYSGAVVEDNGGSNIGFPGAILTHEVGHNFGLIHDIEGSCTCGEPTCIMKTSINPSAIPTKFSTCSLTDLANNWSKGFDLCLLNVPEMVVSPSCGNGIVEDGETCDCGGLPSNLCNPICCSPSTCQLTGSAQCASGTCCDLSTCKVYPERTLCRDVSNPCDLPEVCDGVSSFCPDDTHKHNGLQCTVDGASAYCSEGKCRTRDTQCKLVWGNGIPSSPDSCYSRNTLGNDDGNCLKILTSTPTYIPCAVNDILCGQLFCNVNFVPGTKPRLTFNQYTNLGGCYIVDVDFGSQIPNPAYTPNGAACGENRMCYNNSCIAVADILSVTPCSSACNASGICNNKGVCQCLNGLQYPECTGDTLTLPTTTTTATKTPTITTGATLTLPATTPSTTKTPTSTSPKPSLNKAYSSHCSKKYTLSLLLFTAVSKILKS